MLGIVLLAVFSCVIAEAAPSLLPFDPQWTASEVRDLIAAGADVNERTEAGCTPLLVAAASSNDPEVVKALIAEGAGVNEKYVGNWTPLMVAAAENSNPEVIKALVEAGAEVNAKDDVGWTPLMVAARYNDNPEVIRVLIEEGADGKLKSDDGGTAFDYAKHNQAVRDSDMYLLLENACKANQPGEHGEWLRAAQQEAINSILSGTLYGPGLQPTVRALHGIWDTGISIISANPNVDLSKFEAAYVLPSLHSNVSYPTRIRLSRYLVVKQMLQPDPDYVFKARIAPLRDIGPYTPTIYMRIFLGIMDLMEASEISLFQTYQWLTGESERLQSEGL
jgi:ankyrin repeat protein